MCPDSSCFPQQGQSFFNHFPRGLYQSSPCEADFPSLVPLNGTTQDVCLLIEFHVQNFLKQSILRMLTRELKQRRQQRQRKRHSLDISLFHLCYFAIISTRSTFTKKAYYPGTKLVGVVYKSRKKMKNSPSCVERLFLLLKPIVLRRCRCRLP